MDNLLTSIVVNQGFNVWLGQTKDYEVGICCFSAKHTAQGSKIKDWLVWS